MRKLAALVLVALMGIYGCGGGGDDGEDAAGEETVDTTAPDDVPAEEEPDEDEDGDTAASAECPVELADIEAAFSEIAFKDGGSDAEGSCTFLKEDETGSVTVTASSEDGREGYEQIKSTFEQQAEEVDGVGDEAIWIEGNTTLHALAGDVHVSVQLVSVITDLSKFDSTEEALAAVRDGAIQIAKAAVEKL